MQNFPIQGMSVDVRAAMAGFSQSPSYAVMTRTHYIDREHMPQFIVDARNPLIAVPEGPYFKCTVYEKIPPIIWPCFTHFLVASGAPEVNPLTTDQTLFVMATDSGLRVYGIDGFYNARLTRKHDPKPYAMIPIPKVQGHVFGVSRVAAIEKLLDGTSVQGIAFSKKGDEVYPVQTRVLLRLKNVLDAVRRANDYEVKNFKFIGAAAAPVDVGEILGLDESASLNFLRRCYQKGLLDRPGRALYAFKAEVLNTYPSIFGGPFE